MSEINDPPTIGPVLPAELAAKLQENSLTVKPKTSFGVALPPHLLQKSSQRKNDCPTDDDTRDSSSSSDEEDNVVGPRIFEAATQEDKARALDADFERRAERMKKKLDGTDGSQTDANEREEWMIELPDRLGAHIGMGARTFLRRAAPEIGDRSGWTDIPGASGTSSNVAKKKKKKDEPDSSVQDEYQRRKDKKIAKELEKYNKEKRPETLMKMHAKKRKKEKKKKSKKDEKEERVPFDWEKDMKIGTVNVNIGKMQARPLHFVFRIGDRAKTMHFYRDVLGMKTFRHEEFHEGCKATCNGPYDGVWSKTMIGYGNEDTHFVMELTYNYGIGSYRRGNDFIAIVIRSKTIVDNAKKHGWPSKVLDDRGGFVELIAPDENKFWIDTENPPEGGSDEIRQVILASSDIKITTDYWNGLCGMKIVSQTDTSVEFQYPPRPFILRFEKVSEPIDRAQAFGRLAFACPKEKQLPMQELMDQKKQKILNRLVVLDTPGKQSVQVLILQDPDGHEICFVEDEGFTALSRPDPNANELLDEAMKNDNSAAAFKGNKPGAV